MRPIPGGLALAILLTTLSSPASAQSWEEARYGGETAGALLVGNRVALDIAPDLDAVLAAEPGGALSWSGSGSAEGSWTLAGDGRFCARWAAGDATVLRLAAHDGQWCFYLRRTIDEILLYDPFGNVRGRVLTVTVGLVD